MGPITLSKADEMLWLGRYTERVYTTLREFFETYDGNVDLEVKDFSEFCAACDMPVSPHARVDEFLYDFLYDRENPVSMRAAMRAAFGDAMLLRPELGTETISYVELALINLRRSKEPGLRLV
ncbi:MAG: alpha-E domain-containing protein, partial [Atopobiaceae bacterium]|nr:alpha-E domain-containing protein [Atopobiaceae bacterium]